MTSEGDQIEKLNLNFWQLASSFHRLLHHCTQSGAGGIGFGDRDAPPAQDFLPKLFLCALEEGNDIVRAADISAKVGLRAPRSDETPPENYRHGASRNALHHVVASGAHRGRSQHG
jgi:hypothetical protein